MKETKSEQADSNLRNSAIMRQAGDLPATMSHSASLEAPWKVETTVLKSDDETSKS